MVSILTLNIWQEQGDWVARLNRIESGIRALDPDIVCLQEVRQIEGVLVNQAQSIAERLGLSFVFEKTASWGGGDEGLAVLSKSPIRAHCFREIQSVPIADLPKRSRRIALAAKVERSDGRSLWVITTHLAYRPSDRALRHAQIGALLEFVEEIRGDEWLLLSGDFNAAPEDPEMAAILSGTATATQFEDAFSLCHPGEAGWTWCADNPNTAALSWLPRDRRIDYIFLGQGRATRNRGCIRRCEIALRMPDKRGVLASDHYGVYAEINEC